MSPFLWFENILQRPELTNGIDKGHLLEIKLFLSISFEVVSEIREGKLLLIMSAIFSWKVGPISQWLSIFWILYRNSSSVHSVTVFKILNHSDLSAMHTGKKLPHLVLPFFVFPGRYTHLDIWYLFQLFLSLEIGLSPLWIKITGDLCFLPLKI